MPKEEEKNIREYLKQLNMDVIEKSIYLYGMDFSLEDINHILMAINELSEEISRVKSILETKYADDSLLSDSDRNLKYRIIEDLNRKMFALDKLLENSELNQIIGTKTHQAR